MDDEYLGAASNDYPLGTILHVRVERECNGEITTTREVTVTIVDRMAEDITSWVDLWPASARAVGMGINDCADGEAWR